MKAFQKVIILIGLVTLGLLLWRIDAKAVGNLLLQVRWGFLIILPQELVAHTFNAIGWRLAFSGPRARSFPLWELIRLRVAGDAVNYLTPSATIAGEIARTAMLNDSEGIEVKASSVLVAKVTQVIAQILFGLGGTILFAARLPWLAGKTTALYAAFGGFALILAIAAGVEACLPAPAHAPADRDVSWTDFSSMRRWLRYHYRRHPDRFISSTLFFLLGYLWGTFEAFWICWFLGLRVSVSTALVIEVLSITIDGLLFMVPAKIGTQEGGKTAIFAALGLPAQAGFAFGVVRHLRELAWAGAGMALCSVHARQQARAGSPAATGA